MKLLVGLGNPGEKYSKNRHNVGFILIDGLASKCGLSWEDSTRFEAKIAKTEDFILAKPQTFMNKSGDAFSKILNFYKIDPKDLRVIHDDVDLPLFEQRDQFGAGSAGHRGVESIVEKVGSKDFWRLRVGIGRPQDKDIPIEDWVLQDLSPEEIEKIKLLLNRKPLLWYRLQI